MNGFEQFFINEQSDFFCYMVDKKMFRSKKTYHDYISRLRYVSQFYKLDKSLTETGVKEILDDLKNTITKRDKYNTLKGITDIGSGLKKFLEYVQSDYSKILEECLKKEESSIQNDVNLTETEKESLVKSRIGQGLFRKRLIEYWNGCSVTTCETIPLLMASHIKPWRKSNNVERLDVYNGLLLTPNLDKLFDKGYISFNKKGRIICSDSLSSDEYKVLGITKSMELKHIDDEHQIFLEFHRNNCLL